MEKNCFFYSDGYKYQLFVCSQRVFLNRIHFGFVRGLFSFFTGSFVYMVYKLKKIILNSFFELIGKSIILVFLLFMLKEKHDQV